MTGYGVLGIELLGVGTLQAADVPSEFDDRAVEPQADAEEGDPVSARVRYGHDLPLDAPVAEAARHQDAVHVLEDLGDAFRLLLQVFRIDPENVDRAWLATAPWMRAS